MLSFRKIQKSSVKILGENLNKFELTLKQKGYRHSDNVKIVRGGQDITAKKFVKSRSAVLSYFE